MPVDIVQISTRHNVLLRGDGLLELELRFVTRHSLCLVSNVGARHKVEFPSVVTILPSSCSPRQSMLSHSGFGHRKHRVFVHYSKKPIQSIHCRLDAHILLANISDSIWTPNIGDYWPKQTGANRT